MKRRKITYQAYRVISDNLDPLCERCPPLGLFAICMKILEAEDLWVTIGLALETSGYA
jgi:hypothetical protein